MAGLAICPISLWGRGSTFVAGLAICPISIWGRGSTAVAGLAICPISMWGGASQLWPHWRLARLVSGEGSALVAGLAICPISMRGGAPLLWPHSCFVRRISGGGRAKGRKGNQSAKVRHKSTYIGELFCTPNSGKQPRKRALVPSFACFGVRVVDQKCRRLLLWICPLTCYCIGLLTEK